METNDVLRDQRRELEEGLAKPIIRREALDYFSRTLRSSLIKVVTGVRRCGKSTFIYLILRDKKFAYVNFDDDRLIGVDSNDILASFYEVYGSEFKNIFLDEVQNLDHWELFANRLHRAGFNLFISGSNAKLLSKELATHLTGRHVSMEIFPFSFREFLSAANFREDVKTTKGRSLLQKHLQAYLDVGGFPEVVIGKESPGIYLRGLYRNIVDRDIIARHDISYKKTFREMSQTILSNPGRSISYNKLKNSFRLGSEHTVKNYLSYLDESYLLFLVSRLSYKPVEIEKSDKKVYTIDTGMGNSVSTKFSNDYGSQYENCVAIELFRRRSFNQELEVYYWKSIQHDEVDFALKEGRTVRRLIQVCYNLDDYATKEREVKSLLKASKELKCNNLLVITKSYDKLEEIERFGTKRKIRFLPLWKFLLEWQTTPSQSPP